MTVHIMILTCNGPVYSNQYLTSSGGVSSNNFLRSLKSFISGSMYDGRASPTTFMSRRRAVEDDAGCCCCWNVEMALYSKAEDAINLRMVVIVSRLLLLLLKDEASPPSEASTFT